MTQETLHFKHSGMKIFGMTKVEADITYRELDYFGYYKYVKSSKIMIQLSQFVD